mmetsp:Transcript_13886/g.34725  ORF Transcript_13886/g.34725 Transcript_13886/m.34725 type:complete len:465 (-) Transcript_13886:325-1719(-)
MKPGDRRPTKDMRQAHRERMIQQAREAPVAMDVATPDLAGQRRQRGDQTVESTTPPVKQVRNEEQQGESSSKGEGKGEGQDLEQMYIENDEKAYALERDMEKQRKFHFQKGHAREEEKLFKMSSKRSEDIPGMKIKLTAPNNKHAFPAEKVAAQVVATLGEVDIEIKLENVIVTPLSITGPFIVALHKEAAEYLVEEGVMLSDAKTDPPVTQFFVAKPYNFTHSAIKSSNNEDDIALSIFFNLGAEYTGMHLHQLTEQKDRIQKALIEVFGEPSDFLSYTFVQPKSPMGFYRNAIRAIIKYNKQNEDKVEPQDVNELAKIRFVGMGFGKRPVASTMAAGWRAAFGVEQCCFRQKEQCTKTDERECDLRAQVWAKYSYSETSKWTEFAEKKRKREEDQKIQRDQEMAAHKQLLAERIAADYCSFFLQGKVGLLETLAPHWVVLTTRIIWYTAAEMLALLDASSRA